MATNQNPYLLIVCGPTGSGKSSLPEKVQTERNLAPDNIEKILIDDIIENNQSYKDLIFGYLNQINQSERQELFERPTPKMIKYFNKAYYDIRYQIECHTREELINVPTDHGKLEMFTNLFKNTNLQGRIQLQKNLLRFEA